MRGRGRGGYGRGGGSYAPRGYPRSPRAVDGSPPAAPPAGGGLLEALRSIHGAPYPALRDLERRPLRVTADGGPVTVTVVRAQPDPFAPGSQVELTIPLPWNSGAFTDSPIRQTAAEDYLLRRVHEQLRSSRFACDAIEVLSVSQHVVERSALVLSETDECEGFGTVRCRVQVPGPRRVLDSRQLEDVFLRALVPAMTEALQRANTTLVKAHVDSVEDQEWLRRQLPSRSLVAFVANGSVLPRSAGHLDTPLQGVGVEPFVSPAELEVSFTLPRQGRIITGMGVPTGLTMLVGGGFQGKSTLLRALEVGVYNHALGDGREYVVTHPLAMKIRAEDRRSVQGIDISPFISRLAVPTTSFCTSDASGSTSQAANMVEALELGSPVLLLDEDTCATNLMYRDHAMCQLISPDAEPITTLLQRLPELLATGTSLIVVAGGSGQYFAHANLVIAMDKYVAKNVTGRAKEIAAQLQQPQQQLVSAAGILSSTRSRLIDVAGSCLPLREDADREGAVSVRAHGIRSVTCGPSEIDLSHVEQLVEVGQTNAISAALAWLVDHPPPGAVSTENVVARMAQVLTSQRLMNVVTPSFRGPLGFLALPRTLEIGAALNRLRTLRATSQTAPSSQPPK